MDNHYRSDYMGNFCVSHSRRVTSQTMGRQVIIGVNHYLAILKERDNLSKNGVLDNLKDNRF